MWLRQTKLLEIINAVLKKKRKYSNFDLIYISYMCALMELIDLGMIY